MYNIKVLYKDKVEPTVKLDTNDVSKVSDEFFKILEKMDDPKSDIIGVYISNKSKK